MTADRLDVLRLGRAHAVLAALLGELHGMEVDTAARERLEAVTEATFVQVSTAVPIALFDELAALVRSDRRGSLTVDELRVTAAVLIGWINGLE